MREMLRAQILPIPHLMVTELLIKCSEILGEFSPISTPSHPPYLPPHILKQVLPRT